MHNKQDCMMAIDAGTGSVRAIVFDALGKQIAVSQREWIHIHDERYPGSISFDWQKNWKIIKACIYDVLHDHKIDASQIKGISSTSMREGIVLYDHDGNELLAFSNIDARSKKEVLSLKRKFPELEKKLYDISGQTFALSSIPRLIWVKNNRPDIYRQITCVNMLSDWILYKLSGELLTEPSNASTSGVLSLSTRKWDLKIPELVNIDPSIFPPVFESGTTVGNVLPSVASETGLETSTSVVTGGGDSQLGCIGVGSIQNGQAALFGGSFWQYEYNTNNPLVDQEARLRMNCHAIPNLWQYEGIAWNSGLVMRWFRDAFCQLEKVFAEANDIDVYSLLDAKASKIPAGANGMISTFADVMNFISMKHAAPTFTNFDIDPNNFNKYTFYRSIMENAALITRGHVENIKKMTNKQPKEIIFAGGASKNPLWSQIVADVLGIRIKTPVIKEATALGASLLAGVGTGIYNSLDEAVEQVVHFDKIYEPNLANNSVYVKQYEQWQKVYQAQLALSERNVTRFMWRAPGVH